MTNFSECTAKRDSVLLRQRKLADGSASLFLDIRHNGKRSREFLKLYLVPETSRISKELNKKTMAQAETVRAQRQIDLQSGQYEVLHEYHTNTYFLPFYRQMCEERLKTDSQGNWGNWRSCLRYLEAFCDESTTFKDITPEWINSFKEYLDCVEKDSKKRTRRGDTELFQGLSQNSKVSYFNKLKACINHAFEMRIIPNNPLVGIKGFKQEETKREHLSWEEVVLLDNTPCDDPWLKNAFLFACFTGLRKSDIERLTWSEIQKFVEYTRIVFKQKKTGGQEYMDIPEQAVKYLGPRGEEDEKVFSGFKYGSDTCLSLRRWTLTAGILKDITFHCSRHTFAVLLLNFGADIHTVSKMLGHKELATTQIYTKVLDKKKQAAISLFPSLDSTVADNTEEKTKNDGNDDDDYLYYGITLITPDKD